MVAPDSLMEPPMERSSSKDPSPPLTNGNEAQETSQEPEEVHRPPSYVALACCISGYTTLVYDSKQRQTLRSRPASPIRVDGGRNPTYASECGNFLTPNPRDQSENKMQTQGKGNTYGLDFLNGCGGLHSPRHVANMTITKENINYKSSIVSESYSSYSSSSRYTYTTNTPTSSPTVNGNSSNGSKLITPTNITQQLSPSSFIVQRVERLYGPGALAQGFYTVRKTTSNKTTQKETTTPQSKIEKNEDSLPVLKLLRPEFRAQLTVANRKGRTSVPDKSSDSDDVKEMENLQVTDEVDATAQKPEKINGEEIKDGHYFLKLHSNQVQTLENLAEMVEKELLGCENEEACGILRAASGKARLLVAQKLNQFKGLCLKNIEQSSSDDFPTTNEDLAGFWDMVMIQVEDVISECNKIKKLKNNNWKQEDDKTDGPKGPTPKVSVSAKKAALKKTDPKAKEASRARDEARRKLIEEKRKAMKSNQTQPNPDMFVV
uniref:Disks large-associated protein 1 n=2 Tax=Lygus hesperus TaxID=30085 RepID=A0A146LME6_LYGHE